MGNFICKDANKDLHPANYQQKEKPDPRCIGRNYHEMGFRSSPAPLQSGPYYQSPPPGMQSRRGETRFGPNSPLPEQVASFDEHQPSGLHRERSYQYQEMMYPYSSQQQSEVVHPQATREELLQSMMEEQLFQQSQHSPPGKWEIGHLFEDPAQLMTTQIQLNYELKRKILLQQLKQLDYQERLDLNMAQGSSRHLPRNARHRATSMALHDFHTLRQNREGSLESVHNEDDQNWLGLTKSMVDVVNVNSEFQGLRSTQRRANRKRPFDLGLDFKPSQNSDQPQTQTFSVSKKFDFEGAVAKLRADSPEDQVIKIESCKSEQAVEEVAEAEKKDDSASFVSFRSVKSEGANFEFQEEQANPLTAPEASKTIIEENSNQAPSDSGLEQSSQAGSEKLVGLSDLENASDEEGAELETEQAREFYKRFYNTIKQINFVNIEPQAPVQGSSFVRAPFTIDPALINKWEHDLSIDLQPESIMNYVDEWFRQGIENNEGNWDLRKESDRIKVWTCSVGSDYNKGIPLIRSLHHFPEIDDPKILLRAMNKFRIHWDDALESITELEQFRNGNTFVGRNVNKSVMKTKKRDCIDKKIFFRKGDYIDLPEDDITRDDHYMWITSCPDELFPPVSECTRSDSLMGLNRIGKMRDGQPGTYFQAIVQTDIKANSWTLRLVLPLLPAGMVEWNQKLTKFLNEHAEGLREDDYSISEDN